MSHTSPLVAARLGRADGTITRVDELRAYFADGLARSPDLHFELDDVHAGVDSLAVRYRDHHGRSVIEVMRLGPDRTIVQTLVHHAHEAPPPIPRAVSELAEDLSSHLPLASDERMFPLGDAVVRIGASQHPLVNVVSRLRIDGDVAPRVAEIRGLLRAHGKRQATWEIGPSTRPDGLRDVLLGLGMAPYEEGDATAMVLRRALRGVPSEVRTRPVRSLDDALAAAEVLNQVFGERVETPDERRARVEATWQRDPRRTTHVALIGDRIVAAANAYTLPAAVVLGGGATLPDARGRGAYRALVAARHADAVARGTPVLVVHAGSESRPILEGLGFERVAAITVLHDRF